MITEELEKRKTKDVQFKDVQCDRKLPRSSSLLINRCCRVCPYFGIQGRNSRLRDCTVLRFTVEFLPFFGGNDKFFAVDSFYFSVLHADYGFRPML